MTVCDNHPPQHFRTIFLSDFHIGAKTFNAPALLDFLRKTESQMIYLVGDIFDGWKLCKRWHWTEETSQIFDELFRKAHQGTKIIYIMGNHDEAVRGVSLLTRLRYARKLGIQIKNRVIHKTADGRDFLILHGDQFDRAILRGRVSQWSDRIYDFIMDRISGRRGPVITIEGREKRFSLAKFLSYHGQVALNILNNYETALAREARRSDVHGIICGHTHIPAHKRIGAILYANCGAWLKGGRSAVVETMEGNISLLEWPDAAQATPAPRLPFYDGDMLPVDIRAAAYRYRPFTERLKAAVRRTWPAPQGAQPAENHARGLAQGAETSFL